MTTAFNTSSSADKRTPAGRPMLICPGRPRVARLLLWRLNRAAVSAGPHDGRKGILLVADERRPRLDTGITSLHPALRDQFPDGAPQHRKPTRTCDFNFSRGVVMHMRFLFMRNLRYKQTEVHGGSPSVGLDSRKASSMEFERTPGCVEVGLLAFPTQGIGLYSWGLKDKGHFPA
jgi:hypothetical protein